MALIALASTVAQAVKGQGRFRPLQRFKPGLLWQVAVSALKAQEQHLLLYAPMFLISGNWAYFQLHNEPAIWVAVGLFTLSCGFIGLRRRSTGLFIAGLILLGFCSTYFRAYIVATPMLRGPVQGVTAGGYVADIYTKSRAEKVLVIALEKSSGIPEAEVPLRIRIHATEAGGVQIGDYINFTAYLSPLPRPVEPGGFDYGRMLYFQSIGAGGRMIGAPVIEARPVPWQFEYRRVFRGVRKIISDRITTAIPGSVGHLADSMVSGERAMIPAEMNTSLQVSGLAHIISISGLHMSMVAGGVFWVVRALLALIPFLAMRSPIKKIAAVAALCVGFSYTLLADSGSATLRSYLMIGVMFFAVLVDRPAFSLRNLALAAIVILLVTPEESVAASFQMSFLAVMGLTVLTRWQVLRSAVKPGPDSVLSVRLVHRAWRFAVLSIMTTLVAGGTSTIAAVYHFNRLSPYSVIANGLSLPISEALVMPPALIAVLLMPFELEYWPLKVMELGLNATLSVSDWVASLPAANMLIPKPNVAGIVLIAAGAGVIAAGFGRFRMLGLMLAALGLWLAGVNTHPQVLVEDRAASVALRDAAGNYVFASGSKNKFASGKWLQSNGESTRLIEAQARPGWDCSSGDCFSDLAPMSISYLREESGQGAYCPPTPIIIADYPLHHACREATLVIDRIDVWRKGAHAIAFSGNRYGLTTARDEQGNRPWSYDSRKGLGTRQQSNGPAKDSN